MSDETPVDSELDAAAIVAEPAAEVAAEAEPVIEAAAEAEPDPEPLKKPVHGAVAELIQNRTLVKEYKRKAAEDEPILSRLTPEMRAAITEGRVMVTPKATSTEQRNEQLEGTAKELRLHKADGTLDTEAAGLVERYVEKKAREAVAPLTQAALEKEAHANVTTAIQYATDQGYDVETVRETFINALRAPNGAAMVANPDVAKQLWYNAVGQAVSAGKLPKGKAVAETEKKSTPAIAAESTGRRGPSAGLTLSPALAKVYKDNGLDPNKTMTAGKTYDLSTSVELE